MTQMNSKIRSRAPTASMEHAIISFRNTSQYSSGGPSACGLASVNAVRTILTKFAGGEPVKSALEQEETAMSIMAICQYWTSNEHLDVQDILTLPLFQTQLETLRFEDKQATFDNFNALARSLMQEGPCAAVVTRTPEIVSLMSIPAEGERTGNLLVIFDSHNRPEHPLGAAFLLFYSPDAAATYLSKLFAVDASIMRDMNWQTQMLSHYSAHVMKARPFTEEENIKAVYDANIKLLKASAELKEAMAQESEVQAELHEVRERLDRQKEARRHASLAEAEAGEKLQKLRGELEEARSFANSLQDTGAMPATQWNGPASVDQHRFDRPSAYYVTNINNKGKSVDTGRVIPDTTPNKPDPSKLQSHPKATTYTSEAEEYEKIRLARIAAISAERRQQLQTDKERAQRQAQMEAERNDFETARRLQMEEERIIRQQAELLRTVDRGFECPVCMEVFSIGAKSQADPCGHALCRKCMVSAIKAELESMRWPIQCPLCRVAPPENGEHGVITRDVFELAGAEAEDLDRWAHVELASVSVKVECPTCKRVSQVDQDDYNRTLMLWCLHPGCDAYWCKKCSQLATRGQKHTCDGGAEFERWKKEQKDVKDCPGCLTPIARAEGCRHMTCINPGCNTHFCDRCGELIIKSQVKNDINAALATHYTKCELFDYGAE